MGGFGTVDAHLERRTMAIALHVKDEGSRAFSTFYALCDNLGGGRVRLSDFMRACAGVQSGALWTPKRLEETSDRLTTEVRWKHLTTEEKQSVFAYFVTRFDTRKENWDMSFERFRNEVEPHSYDELQQVYNLCDRVMECGVAAGQLLEIIHNPNIDTFSDDTDWIDGNVSSAVVSPQILSTELGAGSSELAREVELATAAFRACKLNRPDDLERMVDERGLNVDARDETAAGQTLLMIAAANGNKAVCKRLLLLGASPRKRDHQGRTAVDIAAKYNHFALAEYLHSHGVPSGADLDGDSSVSSFQSSDYEEFSRDGSFTERDEERDEFHDAIEPSAPPVVVEAFDTIESTFPQPLNAQHHPHTGYEHQAHHVQHRQHHNKHDAHHHAHRPHRPHRPHHPREAHHHAHEPGRSEAHPHPRESHARESLLHMPD